MKIRILFKTPDAMHMALEEAKRLTPADKWERAYVHPGDGDLYPAMKDEVEHELSKWIKHGEYVTLEFDIVAGTCTVIPTR